MRRVALVSGGSRGIGAACVRLLAENGFSVVFLYRLSDDSAADLVHELTASGLDVSARKCDVKDPAAVSDVLSEVLDTYRHIDVLVNNAGIAWTGLLTDMSVAEWDAVMNTDLRSVFLLSKAVLPGMISRRSGCIINISSMWGQTGASCEVAYSAAKAGVIGFTKALAAEVGPSGIRVNCVAPGVIDTEMNSRLSAEDIRALEDETPLSRIGTAREVAGTVLFLADPASSFITGQVIGVNGGFVL
ncbi:MAG: 3-oxoacyl-ACP reductase FabG [Clostridia bacterium]|nr:3-oxoacyl-ACP reductase FabG [Clostridia bacterium]